MKKNIAYAFFSAVLAAPVISMAQEEAAAPAPEKDATVVEATANAVADTAVAAADAVADTAVAVADATVETVGAVADGLVSVFERASQRDAWDIRLSVFADYGDNRDSVPDGYDRFYDGEKYGYEKEEDVCFGVQPSASFSGHFAGNQHYKLGYSPIYQYWTNPRVGSRRSELSHAAVAEYRYILDTRNDFTVRDDFKYIQNDYWYLDHEDVEKHQYLGKRRTEHEQSHYDNTVTGSWRTQLTERMSLQLKAYWLTIRYDDNEIAATEDEDKYVALAELFRSCNAQFSYGLFGKYEAWDDNSASWGRSETSMYELDRGVSTYTVGLSAAYRASARLRVDARYGWEWVDYDADSIDDRDYPGDGVISLTYAFTMRTRATFGFRYGVTESWVYPFASQDLYSFYTLLRTMHTKRLSSAIRLEYKIAEYDLKYVPAEARTDVFMKDHEGEKKDFYGEISVNYRVTKDLNLSVRYSYEEVDSEVSKSFHENTVGIRATYLF